MRFPPHGFGPGLGVFGIFEDILAGLVFLICLAVVVGVLFVLIRFLLVATKAAEIYVAKNGTQPEPTAPTTPAPTSSAPTTSAPRPRAPKPPAS
jgi:hypothetical protein